MGNRSGPNCRQRPGKMGSAQENKFKTAGRDQNQNTNKGRTQENTGKEQRAFTGKEALTQSALPLTGCGIFIHSSSAQPPPPVPPTCSPYPSKPVYSIRCLGPLILCLILLQWICRPTLVTSRLNLHSVAPIPPLSNPHSRTAFSRYNMPSQN